MMICKIIEQFKLLAIPAEREQLVYAHGDNMREQDGRVPREFCDWSC